jgi:hypothetical protein
MIGCRPFYLGKRALGCGNAGVLVGGAGCGWSLLVQEGRGGQIRTVLGPWESIAWVVLSSYSRCAQTIFW